MADSKKSPVAQAKKPSPSSFKSKAAGAVGILVALTAALSYNFVRDASIDLGLFLGPIEPFNTQGCKVIPGLQTCEDIHLHHDSGLAFTTCGDSESRKIWFPPINKHNESGAPELAFRDKFVIYDINTDKYKVMKLEGLGEDTDRVFHGLGIFERSANDLTIFAVNHRRGGSVIEVLEYSIGDTVVQYKETIRHPLIVTPNDIVAMGERSFYVSNDHRHPTGHMREIEEIARRPWANVIYYSPESTFVAYDGIVSANGMTSNTDRTKLYVSACHGGAMHVFEPQADHSLVQLDHVKLDFYNDNPSFDPNSGSVFITGHVKPLIMVQQLKELGVRVDGPSKVVKMSPHPLHLQNPDLYPAYKVETVLLDDGKLISTGTVAAVDRKRGVMMIGTAFSDRGLIRCPLPEGF